MGIFTEALMIGIWKYIGIICIFTTIFFGSTSGYQYIKIRNQDKVIHSLQQQLDECKQDLDAFIDMTKISDKQIAIWKKYGQNLEVLCRQSLKNVNKEITEEEVKELLRNKK